jgi:octaprenyl-diphosphate synthase
MTLPLIYTLNKVDKQTRNYIINAIKNDSKNSIKVEKIIKLVKSNNGLDYAKKKDERLLSRGFMYFKRVSE